MNYKHGMHDTPIYRTWYSMIGRCKYKSHTSWRWYGAKGISVCERWKSFQNFFKDMGHPPFPRASIERVNPDGDYSPDNCVWATPKQQARNTNRNLLLTLNGKTQSCAAWSEELNIPRQRIECRKARGWSDEQTLTRPPRTDALFEFEGKRKTLHEWADAKGIKYGTVWWRLKNGRSLSEALKLQPPTKTKDNP